MLKTFASLGLMLTVLTSWDNDPDLTRVISHEKHFVVYSSDPALASWAASRSEQVHEDVLKRFQWKRLDPQPLLLHVEFAPSAHADALLIKDLQEGKTRLQTWVVENMFPTSPLWLRVGMDRFLQGGAALHPGSVRALKEGGVWIALEELLRAEHFPEGAGWREVFANEAASLVAFLRTRNPEVLGEAAAGRNPVTVLHGLRQAWIDRIESTGMVLSPEENAHTADQR